ncbi:hypothetical protein [Actinoplanes couchii]|uniref:WXG100 family type VII secretion target n=1 Tax=Actinoplanes couchii TaxID=403638 RepID=A0ABQ3X3S2_9ACTN|nr:hypothetical protein [Actinoplanes couchii]MDR6322926.1 hypothetical protein [Actinoplanes couchii]GID53166.1 hypothetical protein Aco03nite_015700 [Actinoplanes couchii]
MSDGRIKTMRASDPARIAEAHKKYKHISDTIEDTVSQLSKIVSAGEEGLKGSWAEKIKEDAESIKESLQKAGTRYHDAATEIGIYQPELERAFTDVGAAESAEADANASLSRANGLPDPQKGADGTIPPEEEQKGIDKKRLQDEASGDVTTAKNKLNAALDALSVAGKRLGDAVNCKNYDDGLTDKIGWQIMKFFKWLSKIFGYIALAFAFLAVLFPGVGWIVVAGVVAGAVTLIADSVLLAGGDGSVLSVVLGAVGLGLAGLGAAVAKFGSKIASYVSSWKGFQNGFGAKWTLILGPNGKVTNIKFNFSGITFNPGKVGFFEGLGNKFSGIWGNFKNGFSNMFLNGFDGFKNSLNGLMSTWWKNFSGLTTFKDLSFLKGLPFLNGGFNGIGLGLQAAWGAWGTLNQAFGIGVSIIVATMQAMEHPALGDA